MIKISLSNLIKRLSNLVKNSIKMSRKNDKISCFRRLSPFRVEIGKTSGVAILTPEYLTSMRQTFDSLFSVLFM